jgi:hypothetical protein
MKLRMIFGLVAAPLLAFSPVSAEETKSEKPVRVMFVGAYHFGNPGLDLNNAKVDDVLKPRRQKELEALAASLKTFKPTVVAVEGTSEPPYDDSSFAKFTPEDLENVRNEREQIAYRIAHAANITRVYAIDEQPSEGEPDYFPFDRVLAQAKENDETDRLLKMSDFKQLLQIFEAKQKTETIPELLMFWNGDTIPDDFYWNILTFGKGEKQSGAELASYWFMRNAKIFNKLVQTTKPGDRVILVYGSGHGAWLRTMIEKTQGYELEPVLPYLQKAADALKK